MSNKLTAEQIERESIAQVFGLTNGELDGKGWSCGEIVPLDEQTYKHPVTSRHFRDAYDGVPEYAAREDFNLSDASDSRFITVLAWGGGYHSNPAETLVDSRGVWKLVNTYASSGETDCIGGDGSSGAQVTEDECVGPEAGVCAFCEAKLGEEHGCIYIGEGFEAVYQLQGTCEGVSRYGTPCSDSDVLPEGEILCQECKGTANGYCDECDLALDKTGRNTAYCPDCSVCPTCGCPNVDGFTHNAGCADAKNEEASTTGA